MKIPRVGVGTLIYNSYDQILLGERVASHGKNSFGPPGGHLEFGESFEECAIREIKEEIGINVASLEFIGVTNDLFLEDDKHYISIFMKTHYPEAQQIINLEPDKIISWNWYSQDQLPSNLFLPLKQLFENKGYHSL